MAENVKKFKTFDGVEHELEDTQARADIADIAANTYTKTEIDSRLTGYAEKTDVYDKTESYSKTEVDDALALKANAADVYAKTDTYDKTEVDGALTLKANVVDVYSKTESYNKTETDGLLADKANSADVYTITQTDALLDTKCGIDDSSTTATAMTWSASKLNVDFNGKADSSDVYTKAEVDALIAAKGDMRFNTSTGRYEYWDGTQWSRAKLVYEVEQDGSYTLGSALKKLYEDITGDGLAPSADSTLTYVHDGAAEFLHIGYDNNSNAYRYFATYINSSGRVETMCLNPSSTSPYAKKCDSSTTSSMESNTQWNIVRVVL